MYQPPILISYPALSLQQGDVAGFHLLDSIGRIEQAGFFILLPAATRPQFAAIYALVWKPLCSRAAVSSHQSTRYLVDVETWAHGSFQCCQSQACHIEIEETAKISVRCAMSFRSAWVEQSLPIAISSRGPMFAAEIVFETCFAGISLEKCSAAARKSCGKLRSQTTRLISGS